ncbi:MAG: hypothetical protein D6736_18765 [Nitrospinota bacterium]|nr:MAG: hypothetical protein D6736_18765 [Nitrospinota bacterium]
MGMMPGMGMMREMMRRMPSHMRRHFYDPILRGKAQEAFTGFGEEKFWLGKKYGVAVRRATVPGVIVITADADYILNFRKEIGVQRLIEDLKSHPLITAVSLQDTDYTYIAHTDARRIGTREEDPFLRQSLESNTEQMRLLTLGEKQVLEVTRPFFFQGKKIGLFRVALDSTHIEQGWRRSVASIFTYSLILFLLSVVGVVVISRIQERDWQRMQQLERELEQNRKLAALGNLAAGVAHEIKNPLNAISMGIQRLQREFLQTGDQAQEEFLQLTTTIRKEIQRLNGIVEQTLQLARPLPLQREPFDPQPVFQEIALLMEEEARTRGVTWRVNLPSTLPVLRGDPRQLKQALLNIILNAFQATPAGGEVSWQVESTGKALRLRITDTGEGMPPEVREKIFDPYFTTKQRGVGLGLSIAHHIIQAHAGSITVHSQPGQGTAFQILLPLPEGGQIQPEKEEKG